MAEVLAIHACYSSTERATVTSAIIATALMTGQTQTYRRSWATLLARVFRIDVTRCPDCGGRMKIIAALTVPSSTRRCLHGMGLPARSPPIAPARPEPQTEFDYA